MDFNEIMKQLLAFRDERDWRQFHDPKNLAAAIAIEAAELQEIFLWCKVEESRQRATEKKKEVADEIADIMMYCLLFAHETGVDIEQAIKEKMLANARKYPVEKARGNSKKYNE